MYVCAFLRIILYTLLICLLYSVVLIVSSCCFPLWRNSLKSCLSVRPSVRQVVWNSFIIPFHGNRLPAVRCFCAAACLFALGATHAAARHNVPRFSSLNQQQGSACAFTRTFICPIRCAAASGQCRMCCGTLRLPASKYVSLLFAM